MVIKYDDLTCGVVSRQWPVTALVASGAKGKVVKEAPKSGRRTTLNKSKTKNKQGGKQKDPLKAKIDQ